MSRDDLGLQGESGDATARDDEVTTVARRVPGGRREYRVDQNEHFRMWSQQMLFQQMLFQQMRPQQIWFPQAAMMSHSSMEALSEGVHAVSSYVAPDQGVMAHLHHVGMVSDGAFSARQSWRVPRVEQALDGLEFEVSNRPVPSQGAVAQEAESEGAHRERPSSARSPLRSGFSGPLPPLPSPARPVGVSSLSPQPAPAVGLDGTGRASSAQAVPLPPPPPPPSPVASATGAPLPDFVPPETFASPVSPVAVASAQDAVDASFGGGDKDKQEEGVFSDFMTKLSSLTPDSVQIKSVVIPNDNMAVVRFGEGGIPTAETDANVETKQSHEEDAGTDEDGEAKLQEDEEEMYVHLEGGLVSIGFEDPEPVVDYRVRLQVALAAVATLSDSNDELKINRIPTWLLQEYVKDEDNRCVSMEDAVGQVKGLIQSVALSMGFKVENVKFNTDSERNLRERASAFRSEPVTAQNAAASATTRRTPVDDPSGSGGVSRRGRASSVEGTAFSPRLTPSQERRERTLGGSVGAVHVEGEQHSTVRLQ